MDARAIEQGNASAAPVRVERPVPAVALLTLNRPELHNALDHAAIAALAAAIETAGNDAGTAAIILTGAGRSFCSGDDLKALQRDSLESFDAVIHGLQDLARLMFASPKPIVAALNGPAYGAGLELVLACDVRIATGRFLARTPEVRLGLGATNGASLLLPLLIGQSRARTMLLGGEAKGADWCVAAGLVDEIVPAEALLPRAVEIAADMAKGAPGALAATRRMLNAPLEAALADALRIEAEICIAGRRTGECAEGVAAFFARRPPDWGRS